MSILLTLGEIQISQAAKDALRSSGVSLDNFLRRHQSGDWIEEGEGAQRQNEFAAKHGFLVAAEYKISAEQGILIVTAQDRLHTSVLLPDEFQYKEVGVVEGYARWARRYDNWKNPLIAVEEPVMVKLLQGLQFKTALDVGTGTGRNILRLTQRGVYVVGYDISREMLNVAQSKTLNEKDLLLVQGTIEGSLPFRKESFDLIMCSLVLSHMSNLGKCIQEFARLQPKHGSCLVSAFHPEAIATAGWRTSLQETDAIYRLPNMPHTREDYMEAFQNAGYKIKQTFDLRVADVPDGYFPPELVAKNGDKGLCLIVLAEFAG